MDIAVIDFEAFDWVNLYAVGVYDGKQYRSWFHGTPEKQTFSTDETVRAMFEILEEMKLYKHYIYAHNGGKYDFLPIIRYCAYQDVPFKLKRVINGRIAELHILKENGKPKFRFRDSIPLLPASFKSLAESFDVEHQKEECEDYTTYVDPLYLEHDVKGMYEVIQKFTQLYKDFGGEKIPLTISASAYKMYWNLHNPKNKYCINPALMSDEINFRRAYYGGRTEMFKRFYSQKYAERCGHSYPLYYYDVNSLYPSQMIAKKYPVGDYRVTNEYEKGKLGIYYVSWSSPHLSIPFLPFRDPDGRLIFPNGENVKGWYCSPEIDKALALGYKVKVYKGYVWDKSEMIFNDYVKKWYEVKKNSNGGKRAIAKLMLNSLYGRFAMSREKEEILNQGETSAWVDKYGWGKLSIISHYPFLATREAKAPKNVKIMPHISAFVSCYARICLYEFIQKVNFKVWYCDTDSIITDQKINTSKEIGDMSLEDEIDTGYFLLPKVYAYKTVNGDIVKKAKGIDASLIDITAFQTAALTNNFNKFQQTKERILGFKESIRRGAEIFSTEYRTKQMYGVYTKRILDGYNTTPLTVRNNNVYR